MPDIDGDNGAAKNSLCMFLTCVHDGNSKGLIVLQQKVRDLEIAHWCHAISRLCKPSAQSRDWHPVSRFWECAAQSQDCANS